MKYLFAAAFIFFCANVFAQDTIYYADSEGAVTNRELASHYKIVEFKGSDTGQVTVKHYLISDKIVSEINYSLYSDSKKKLHGKTTEWDENGQKISEANYKEGKHDGQLSTYWSNGQLRRNEIYDNGMLIKGNCYTQEGKDTVFYDYETMPYYPGGQDALFKFLRENIKYPKAERRKGIQGKVYINFVVDKEGNVTDVKTVRGVSPALDAEAMRVVKLMPQWRPGFQDGKPVSVHFNLPIYFTLKN